mmetsp:Transcript_25450/g.39415  ORF Transcript_25450/g.39415 Transcript_25450/m.39415 type:complete len:204 (+) Transcript_25450:535-1146(+)
MIMMMRAGDARNSRRHANPREGLNRHEVLLLLLLIVTASPQTIRRLKSIDMMRGSVRGCSGHVKMRQRVLGMRIDIANVAETAHTQMMMSIITIIIAQLMCIRLLLSRHRTQMTLLLQQRGNTWTRSSSAIIALDKHLLTALELLLLGQGHNSRIRRGHEKTLGIIPRRGLILRHLLIITTLIFGGTVIPFCTLIRGQILVHV